MRSARFDYLLAGTAIALTLSLSPYSSSAFASTDAAPPASAQSPIGAVAPPAANNETPARPAPAPAANEAVPPAAAPANAEALQPEPAPATTEAAQPAPAAAEATQPAPAASEVTTAAPGTGSAKEVALSAAGTAIAEKLREHFAAGKFDRILGGKKDRGAVEAFYAGREFAPLWITDGAMNGRAKETVAYLAQIATEGLDPNDYPIPEFNAGAEAQSLAEAEIRLTDTVLSFARHAMGGRVHFSRVSSDIMFDIARPDPANVLTRIANAKNAGDALNSFHPPQPLYQALKAKLAEVRHVPLAQEEKVADRPAPVRVPDGNILRPGMSDPRVVSVRKRLNIEGDKNNPVYDDAVLEAVKGFQTQADITVDGMLGPVTVRAMNGDRPAPRRPAIAPVDAIVANMERLRWLPRDLGQTYVMVNIPDYSLRVVRDNKLVWKTKIVVGKPHLATPMLSAEMKFITVNPTWNVPPSIIQNEYLPALQQDPQALERIGLKVEQGPDGTVRIWQPPGDRNALGRIRFNFPNKFLVYQHDTPDKYLFKHDKRAYSHGCMRVENPLKYGEVLLSLVLPNERYTEDRLRGMFGGSEININFPTHIPVHLTYQTAFVDEAGKLVIRDDVYGRDTRLLAIMKGSERKVADTAIDRPRTNSAAPVRMPPGTFGNSYGGSYGGNYGGPSFFQMLFGAPEPAPPKPRERVGRAGERHRFR